ncbi:MAG TPA: acyl-CoA dehydrogenase family protein, partial [Hyphomicrobiaceae bacterium]
MATAEQKAAQDEKQGQNGDVDAAAQATDGLEIDAPDSSYSLELSQDQKDIREWAHGFAEQTVRPAAHEWDEKEEFPWPVVQ